jgi:hemerythrin-like domain-containing protein
LAEHHDIEEYCEDLSVRDKSGDAWLDTAKKLSAKVRHHLKEEEKKFFQVAGRILSDPQKALLARRYEKDVIRMRRKLAADYQKVDVSPSGRLQPAV